MPSADILLAFAATTAIFAFMPGPAMLYAAARTIAGGKRAGWMAALGIHIGGYTHVIIAALGLAVLFKAVPVLYLAFKFLGAGYLIWLGISMLKAKEPHSGETATITKSPQRAFWNSVLVEVLNPKTALFYLAFLPQFTDPAAALPIWMQLLILGAIVNIMFSIADVICVVLATRIISLTKTSKTIDGAARKIGGTILVGLGLRLAVSSN